MATSILELILRTKKQGTGAGEVTKELQGVQKAGFDSKVALGAAAAAAGALAAAYKLTVSPTVALAEQVRDLGRIAGISAEESSLLIQAADDLKVDFDTLKRAAKEMTDNGLQPNLKTLGQLGDQYNKIQDPVEKTQFAIKNFGKAGLEMTKILEAGSEGLAELEAGARSAGLVMDEQAVQAARDYEIALDGLQDQLKGLQITFGNAVIPTLAKAAEGFTSLIKVGQALSIVIREKTGAIDHETAVMEAARLAGVDLAAQTQSNTVATQGFTAAEDALAAVHDRRVLGMQQYTQQLLFQEAASHLDEAAQFALAQAMGLVDKRTLQAHDAVVALTEKYDTNRDGAISAAEASHGYLGEVLSLRNAIDSLSDRTVTVTTIFAQQGAPGPFGPGGPEANRQGGGSFGRGPLVVGEGGPELLFPQRGGFVMSNADSRRLIAALEALAGLRGPSTTINVTTGAGADAIAREVSRVLAGQARGHLASRASFGVR